MCNRKIKQTLGYDTYIKHHHVVPTCFYAVLLFPFKVLLITTDFLLFVFKSIELTTYIITHIVFSLRFFLLINN